MNWLKLGIVATLVAVLYFGWQSIRSNIYQEGYAAAKAEADKLTATAKEAADEIYRINRNAKEKALENQKSELVQNIAAADRARIASERVRDSSERSLATATNEHAACVVSAATHAELFAECRREYGSLGQKAQGHVTDIKALIESWPK